MIQNKPSIYNAQSVYNQGVGGGGGGGGTYHIPDFLQPVEYYLNTSPTANNFGAFIPFKCVWDSATYKWECSVAYPGTTYADTNNVRVFSTKAFTDDASVNNTMAFDYRGSDGQFWARVGFAQSDGYNGWGGNTGKITFTMKYRTVTATLGGTTKTATSSYTPLASYDVSGVRVGGEPFITGETWTGNSKFYEVKFYDDSNDLIFWAVPCRHKFTGDLYILDVIGGNYSSNLKKSVNTGITFGPDITIQ